MPAVHHPSAHKKFGMARWTGVGAPRPFNVRAGLQKRFLAALVARCTYLMNWFAAWRTFFQDVSERPEVGYLLQLIALFLRLPCFHISNLFFEIAYALNQRRAFLVDLENARLGIHEPLLKFAFPSLKGLSVSDREQRLRHVLECLKGRHGARKTDNS